MTMDPRFATTEETEEAEPAIDGFSTPNEAAVILDEAAGAADEAAVILDEAAVGADQPVATPGEAVVPPDEQVPIPEAAEALPAPRTVGRLVADALRTAGVRYAFTVPGESFLGLLDTLGEAGIRVIATRHEGAAAFMAEAHAQLTGRPAACLGTRAVGAANLAIGIHTARQDSAPMFAIVGQVQRAHRGHEAFQEIDQVATIGGLAKWATEPDAPEAVAPAMGEAIRQALSGRPGPVLVSLPEDLLDLPAPPDARVDGGRSGPARPADDDVRSVIELLASARRPVILAGGGVLHARTSTELLRFAELLQVPVIAAWRRADVISNDHPLYLGMAGFGAAPTVRERLAVADAMLVIGCRLNEPTSFDDTLPAATTRWAHVDIEPRRSAGTPAQLVVAADARAFLRAATERLVGKAVLDASLVGERQANNTADREAWESASDVAADPGDWDGPGVHPGRTIATLRRVLPDDAILTTDAGNFAGWAGRGFRFRRPGTFIGPTSGAMGYGLPAAIAASLIHRDRPVVALVGDGGLAMTMAELETAVREQARVIVVCFDNQRFGTIRMWQERRGTGQGVATELGAIDFAAIGRAVGARGAHVERDDEFEPALRQALAEDRSTVIQVALDRRWVSVDIGPTSD
jgi:acetolactate synthase I/II/III large subunit